MQLLLQYLEDAGRYIVIQVWLVLNPNQPLSWKTLLSLCVFSWLMAFITSDAQWIGALAANPAATDSPLLFLGFQMSFARWLLFTSGWIFLCLSIAWMLAKSSVTLPFFGLKIYPAAWVVGLLSSTYVFLLGRGDVQMGAIVAWPALSAIYTLLPKLISSKGKFQPPPPAVRQQFVMLLFASATVSCWLQFWILTQGWLLEYPALRVAPLDQSTLITALGTDPTVAKIAQDTLDQTVQLLPEDQLRGWLRNLRNPDIRDRASEGVNAKFQAKLLQAQVKPLGDDAPVEADADNGDDADDDNGDPEDQPVPTPPSPVVESWRLMVVREEAEAQAVRLQLRSLLPIPANASGLSEASEAFNPYIEYLCRIQKYLASDRPPGGTTANPTGPSTIPTRPIAQPVPTPEAGANHNTDMEGNAQDIPVPSTPEASPTNPGTINGNPEAPSVADDSPSGSGTTDENPENYRRNTIACEFTGLHIP